ncbi:MAG: hypothetical protein HY819_15710 [Acidobacteria bacterium]|nr:hypothetical protein [Acidobacteriota bacterium]
MKDTKNEQMDLQIDKLLRNHLKNNQVEKAVKCQGFDPDLATAYAEKILSNVALKNYEGHLAACKNCRQMTAEYMLMFASELPAIEEVNLEPVKEIIEPSTITKENNLSWISIKEWLFGSQVRFALAAVLLLFISGAIWVFSTKNTTNQIVENSVETPKPNNPVDVVNNPETALNNNPEVNPTPQPTNVKTPGQNQGGNKNNLIQPLVPNNLDNQEKLEVANKENKSNSVKLPSIGKEDNLPEIANNNKSTPSLPTGENLQVPPPPIDIAQNTEKNTQKESTTNSGSSKTPRNTPDFGLGVAENVKDKRSVGGKTFQLKSGVWTDKEYLTNAKAKALKKIELKKGSPEYKKALEANPVLKDYFDIGTSVMVIYKDSIYIVNK